MAAAEDRSVPCIQAVLVADDYNSASPLKARLPPRCVVDVSLIQHWLRFCETNHRETCGSPPWSSRSAALPELFRVIDVQSFSVVKAPKDCRYFALSYVRGKDTAFQTTGDNIDKVTKAGGLLTVSVPLSQCVLDAMNLVRAMGDRYLWVDAICIVQGDVHELQSQIRHMDTIYTKAALTFVSAGGSSSSAGLPGVWPHLRVLPQVTEEVEDGIRIALPLEPAAFEIEFYLYKKESEFDNIPPKGLDHQSPSRPWSSAAHMRGTYAECVEDCMLSIEKAGLVVEQGHAECSFNQFEISVGPLPPTTAVDSLMCVREIIKGTASRHGFAATFFPKPSEKLSPTGLHLHLSVHRQPSELQQESQDPSVDQLTNASTRIHHSITREMSDTFLGGILTRLGALFAISIPSQDSYLRTVDSEAMGSYVAWGKENSYVPVSEVSTGYWEIRSLDWTTNIYLAIAAYLSAGLLGIQEKEKLRWQDSRDLTDHLAPRVREALGINELLPKSLGEAMEKFIASQYGGLQEIMGEEILDLYTIVKTSEYEYTKSLSGEERKTLYMHHI